MTDQIEWGDPPAVKGGRGGKWGAILDEFRARPGEWGKVPGRSYQQSARNIRLGLAQGSQPPGSFEAHAVDCREGQADLWVRYVGEVTP